MPAAQLPPDEAARLAALRDLKILDTPPEETFERITSLAARIFSTPLAIVSLVDEHREWFKACYGTDQREADRKIAFCAHTILSDETLVVEDARRDPRFADNPQVTEQGIRCYVGAPLRSSTGFNIGALCVKDTEPRKVTDEQVAMLEDLAAMASREMEMRLAAQRIARGNESLRRKNAELDEFSYIASHDLQEPLRKMVSFSRLLEMDLGGDIPEAARKDLEFITDAARRMSTLVQDLLALSRSGRAALRSERLRLDDCVDRALHDLATRIEESGATIERNSLPEVIGDATTLSQLFQNLVSNALKFSSPERKPVVSITSAECDEGWHIKVSDNGIGIKPEHTEMIFAPFKRLHGRDEYEGTGIGLAICRKTVERHGGQLCVESNYGEGTTFHFTLEKHPEVVACPA